MNMIKNILIVGLFSFSSMLFAQAGSLDTTFNGNGKVLTNFFTATSTEEAEDLAIQADGKIVVAGYVSNGTNYDFAVVRYNVDGTLDATFGTGGKLAVNISNYDMAYAVAINTDGKILVAGVTGATGAFGDGNFGVIRLNSNGSTDTSFGTNGVATVSFPGSDYFTNMKLQSDGKILLCGYNVVDVTGNYSDFSIARLNADGTLDFDFSNDGKSTINFNSDDRARTIQVDATGNIYLGGSGSSNICIVKLFSDGSIDTSYATNGKVNTRYNTQSSNLNDMILLDNGSIVFTGFLFSTEYQMLVGKLNVSGAFDTSFGTNGATVTDVDNSSEDTAYSLVIQSDEKIIISGRSYTSGSYYFAILRYTSSGVLDNTFSNDGKVLTAFGTSWSMGHSSALQSDGKLVVTGIYGSFYEDFATARYNTGAPLSTSELTKNLISVYPNPTRGLLNITCNEDLNNEKYLIVDSLGRTVETGTIAISNPYINLSNKQNGLYYLSIPSKSVSVTFIKN
jgi:uncharacterized delta-60 repeat protein